MMRRITVLSEHTVTVLTEGREERKLSAPVGALFLQLLKGNGYSLVCCNGKGGCGRCRIRFLDGDAPPERGEPITKADLFAAGLSGRADSAERRQALLRRLDLPEHMTANALLEVLNTCYSREEALRFLQEAPGGPIEK